jgi:hypothetical protein
MIKLIDLLREWEELPNGEKAYYFRSVEVNEKDKAVELGYLPYYSKDPMSTDWEVIELSMQESNYEGDPEEYVRRLVAWRPIEKGVNVTTDFDNAVGYGNYVLALDILGSSVDFTSTHVFAKNPKQVKLVGVYDTKSRKWLPFTPNN